MSSHASKAQPFGAPMNFGREVNSGFAEERPCVSPDGKTLIFMSDRHGGQGFFDLRQATRSGATA